MPNDSLNWGFKQILVKFIWSVSPEYKIFPSSDELFTLLRHTCAIKLRNGRRKAAANEVTIRSPEVV